MVVFFQIIILKMSAQCEVNNILLSAEQGKKNKALQHKDRKAAIHRN